FQPPRDLATPLYVQEQGSVVGKSKTVIVVSKSGCELGRARLRDVSQLVLCGNIMVTAQAMHLLCESNVPIVHLSTGNWFYGVTHGLHLRNAFDRSAQFQASTNPEICLNFAKAIVTA